MRSLVAVVGASVAAAFVGHPPHTLPRAHLASNARAPPMQLSASASVEPMNLWDAPKRVVEVDGGMRARGLSIWLQEEHAVDMSKLELRQSPLEGLGVFAAHDLAPGEQLFDVPQSCCIYRDLVFADRQLGKSMQALASKAGRGIETVSLATFLAREKMVGADSRFQPFIEVLPWDSLHPLLWTEAELELLEGTYAFDSINALLDEVDVATEIFEPVLNPKGWKQLFQAIETNSMDSDDFAFLMRGAFASVISRNFESTIGQGGADVAEEDEQRVIIPLLDIFNHHPLAPTISFDAVNSFTPDMPPGKRSFAVSARQREGSSAIAKGEELFNYYGTKPNWEMLTSYGFVSSNSACQESTLTTQLATDDPLYEAKRDALAKLGIKPEGQIWDIQHGKKPSDKLWAYLRIACLHKGELAQADAAMRGQVSEDNERRAKALLGQTVKARREFLSDSRAAVAAAKARGQETLVRAEVADIVLQLLDSEWAALDDFSDKNGL